MRYSILMPFFNRVEFQYTLMSFEHHYSARNDYEVIIVEDIKTNTAMHSQLMDMLRKYENKINIKYFTFENPGMIGTLLYNYAAKQASGDILMLTNPECFHESNILAGLDSEFKDNENKYIVCACKNVQYVSGDSFDNFKYNFLTWYEHESNRRLLHFCSAIQRSTYFSFGGFDPEFAKGIWYDDDDFKLSIIKTKIPIVSRDDLITLHINHDRSYCQTPHGDNLREINRRYLNKKWKL